MEGAAWTLGKEQPGGELSCRALPAFTEHGPPPPPSVTGPSPYATTALLDTAHQSTESMGGWVWPTAGSRESLPPFGRPAPLAGRSQSSGVLLARAGHPSSRGGVRLSHLDPGALGADSTHRYGGPPGSVAGPPTRCEGSRWLVHASCSRHSLAPGSAVRIEPPRSRSFACPPRSARPHQRTSHYVSAALSEDLNAAYRGDPRDTCPQYERTFATCDR
ncbi:hypothetical protein FJT64_008881 [Amphibalanus amphitrite]|uniref:Uncharacterized protein n=1 Tax=Amphibalanus amphitrite TaxID=1232801 RepID=A0A6A4VI08_AMPAM|nr:hypothetical protein FJT64_008881 [Amphibalanus amphitrite]